MQPPTAVPTAFAVLLLFATTGIGTSAQETRPVAPDVAQPRPALNEDFEEAAEKPDFVLRKHRKGSAPKVEEGALHLLDGELEEMSSAAWPRTASGAYRTIDTAFALRLDEEAHGFAFMLLHTAHFGAKGPAFQLFRAKGHPGNLPPAEPMWDEPNLWGSFAVGFDVHDPPTEDPFDAQGNVHARPEREISLHFDGREVTNRFCTPELATGKPIAVKVHLDFVTGGADVSVTVSDAIVYDRFFVPHLLPYESRVAVGAYGPEGGHCDIDDLAVRWERPAAATPAPITLHTFRSAWMRPRNSLRTATFELLPPDLDAERILMTFRLRPVMNRDEWDRLGGVYVWDGEERFELARILTPFMLWGQTYEYVADVTDFAPLLRGRRKLGIFCGSAVNQGFAGDLEFTVYRRPPDVAPLPKAIAIRNVWNGRAHFNRPESLLKVFGPRSVEVPEKATSGKLRIVVTGHGTLEFKPLRRTVWIGDREIRGRLWTQDGYLNPWRPQFGTWKYDRAGWSPGSLGRVWEIPLGDALTPGQPLELEYESVPFEAKKWAEHVIESQLIFYGTE